MLPNKNTKPQVPMLAELVEASKWILMQNQLITKVLI